MKNSMMLKIFTLLAFIPTYLSAQETEKNVELNTIEIRVSVDKVPPVVKGAFVKDFGEGHQPMVWATTSSKFDTYGWEQSVDVQNQEIYYYALHTQTSNGGSLDAVYTPDGKLIRSREEVKNFEPPQVILASLEKSNYKDWKIAKDVHVIKVYEGKTSKDQYALRLEKGKQKKVVYFDKSGNMLVNKKM